MDAFRQDPVRPGQHPRGGAPRCARGNPGRRLHRSGIHLLAAVQDPRRRHDRSGRTPPRIPADAGLRRHAAAGGRAREGHRGRAVEHHRHRRRQVRRESAAAPAFRPASRDRARPLPDRRRPVPECSAFPRRHGAARGRRLHGACRRAWVRAEPGRCLDGDNAYLDRFIDEQRLLTPGAPAGSDELTSYLHWMRTIGRRIAELQNVLASRPDIAEFAPVPVTPDDMARWSAALVQHAEATFTDLSRPAHTGDAMRALIDRLAGPVERLLADLRTPLAPPAISKIRHHGDLHLGQVLLAKDDVYILDFEGEPQRSLEERRRKAPAARDIAGLVRSIDYAATATLERALETWTDEHDRLFNALEDWSRQSVATFMAAYREGLASPLPWPGDGADADRLLDFFLLEKVFYEINYELANRPNWLRVPLTGLQRILSQRS